MVLTAHERGPVGGYLAATRINSFRRDGRSVADAIRAAAAVPELAALELNFPQHVVALQPGELRALLAETGLRLTGLNLRFEDPAFANGAFTAPDRAARQHAIDLARQAVAFAREHNARHVVLWMADDGYDYPFQVDYERLWQDEIDGFRRVADADPACRVSVEYKPRDPRRFALIRSMGDALLAVREVGRANFGVTLDVCHSFMAGEHPPFVAAQALREGRLFGMHLNDGYGPADDGLIVGSIHRETTLELLALLAAHGYDGTIYFDTFPAREDPAAELRANLAALRDLAAAASRIDWAALGDAQTRHDAIAALALAAEAQR
ncbi:MAG: TIM barrel protein [Thermomicrobiales bacterium]|nr:TIM barrel protein [Thermomicrobiales bacterium]